MIRACADARDPQPERARDLWIEMTAEGEKVVPRREEYDAIIRALSSTKKDYLEAFELLRQMIARHQDAVLVPFEDEPTGAVSDFVPTVETFTALLEGTKRAGDLERARWILSELVRLVKSSEAMGERRLDGPDEEVMSGVFMTYAGWQPPIKREGVKTKFTGGEAKSEVEEGLEVDLLAETANASAPARTSGVQDDASISPRTSTDAIREATALFERILYVASLQTAQRIESSLPLRNVHLNTRLVNSYLSVHLAHAPSVSAALEAWESTWQRVQEVRGSDAPNGWSYLHVLERCSTGQRGVQHAGDRTDALKWGKQTWEEYCRVVEARSPTKQQEEGIVDLSHTARSARATSSDVGAGRRERWLLGLGERQVERCWRAIIRIHALSDDTTTALSRLDEFHNLYPPSAVVAGYAPLPNVDLSIRMSSIGSTPEADVPPHLLWKDLDVLHQRLVTKEDRKGVARVKWIAKSYEGALLKRRRFRRKGVGLARERKREQVRMERLGRVEEVEGIGGVQEVEDGGWEFESNEEENFQEEETTGLKAAG